MRRSAGAAGDPREHCRLNYPAGHTEHVFDTSRNDNNHNNNDDVLTCYCYHDGILYIHIYVYTEAVPTENASGFHCFAPSLPRAEWTRVRHDHL